MHPASIKHKVQTPELSGRRKIQTDFLEQMGPTQQVAKLFEYLPGIYFFIKDKQSRMICASEPILQRLGVANEDEFIGTTDYDYFPDHVADLFVKDDQQVFNTGEPMIGRVEIWFNEQGLLDWFVTTKLPIVDTNENIIGLMGSVQAYDGARKSFQPYSEINRAVDYIRSHHREKMTVNHLAKYTGISTRQLHRKFREFFGMGVQEFLAKTRIQSASDMLITTDLTIAEIAVEFGFCDQSAFTQQFRKHTGMTPLKYRKRYAGNAE